VLFRFSAPITWRLVISRTLHEIDDDNCLGLAAQLSFYFLLGLFPALLVLVALIGYVPLETTLAELLTALSTVAPQELIALIQEQLAQVAAGNQTRVLTLGILGALWSSSAAMVAIIDALNHAFDVTEWRPWWKRRLVAVALTMSLAVFTVLSLVLVLVGPMLAARIAEWFGLEPAVAVLWSLMRWPVLVGCIVFGVDLVYHFAPNRRTQWILFTPGSVLATAIWIAGSFAFKFYVANFGDYTATYGAIGGAIVTMLWFYVSSMAILIGAELNGVLEDAWRAAARQE